MLAFLFQQVFTTVLPVEAGNPEGNSCSGFSDYLDTAGDRDGVNSKRCGKVKLFFAISVCG